MDYSSVLNDHKVLITGGAKRIGRALALSCARAGAEVVIHHAHSSQEASELEQLILNEGGKAIIVQKNLQDLETIDELIRIASENKPIDALVNNAAIFEPIEIHTTSLMDWQRHLDINLTAPLFLCKAFSAQLPEGKPGRIVNILDWRAFRPGTDHLPYTISKSALASLTFSLAQSLAPSITVNGLALGAILKPADGGSSEKVIQFTPASRWATLDEVSEALLFLLSGPAYITGEIIHVDGGRHLV